MNQWQYIQIRYALLDDLENAKTKEELDNTNKALKELRRIYIPKHLTKNKQSL